MTPRFRQTVLRANSLYLLIAASGGMVADLAGVYLAAGPVSTILSAAPHATIGMVEAHGLALIVGGLLWSAESTPKWHLAGAAVHVLLGAANLAFWPIFVAGDMLAVGYVTTALHGLFAALQLAAFVAAIGRAPAGQAEIKPLSTANQTGLTA